MRTITVNREDREPVCRLTFCVARGLFGTRLVSLPFSDYGGPLLRKADLSKVGPTLSEAVDSLAVQHDARYVLFKSTPPDLARFLTSKGFELIHQLGTFVVHLSRPFTEIEKDFDKDIRRRVRRGMQEGLKLTNEQGGESIKSFYEAYLHDMRRHGSPPHDRKYFENIREKFESSGQLKLFGCEYEGATLGYVLHFLYKDTAHFYMGVWPGRALQMGVAPFLVSNSIRSFAEDGYRFFDFGRTFCPSGEYSFKQSFGGEYRSQNSLVRIYNGGKYLEPSDWKYRTLSHALKHTPLRLLATVGPKLKKQIE